MKTKIDLALTAAILIFIVTAMLIPVSAKENNAQPLQKLTFIHYKKGVVKKPSKTKGTGACYRFLANGTKWKSFPVNYVIDPANPNGLSESFVTDAIYQGAEEWDKYTSKELFGSYEIDYTANWDSSTPDGKNELVFGNYSDPGVIAITNVWGYFSGPTYTRKIVEFDVMFDTDFTWGNAAINPTVMDLQNIATHEVGHGAGMGDLYNLGCSEETMYGYSSYGEIQKRDLNTGDILGIQKLYGI